jgi:hypothetical protein
MTQSRRKGCSMVRVQVTFEMSRVAAACLVDAYEQVVPIARRSTAQEQGRRRSAGQQRAEGEA